MAPLSKQDDASMIKGQFEEIDYMNAQRLSMKLTWVQWIACIAISVGALPAAIESLLFQGVSLSYRLAGISLAGVIILGWLTWAFVRFVFLPVHLSHFVKRQASPDSNFEMNWNTEEIVIHSVNSRKSIPWSSFVKWREDSRVFLLYLPDNLMMFVPKRFFQNEESIAAFGKAMRAEAVRPRIGKRPNRN